MSYKTELTREDLAGIFRYEGLSGELIRKHSNEVVKYSDMEQRPRASFKVKGKAYFVDSHSIIWLLCYGQWPDGIVFHRDFDPMNLRLSNLKVLSVQENRTLLTAYKNLKLYCDIKQHNNFTDTYLVRYISDNRLKTKRFDDYGFACAEVSKLKDQYRRVIVEHGGIPPA